MYIALSRACKKYFIVKKTFGSINFLFRQSALTFNNIRISNTRKYEEERFQECLEDSYDKNIRFQLQTGFISPVFLLLFNLSLILFLYVTSFYVQHINIDLFELMIFFQYLLFFFASIKTLPHINNLLIRTNATSKRIEEIFALEDKIKDDNTLTGHDTTNILEFKNVNYAYNKEAVLKDVTFNVERNTNIAIIGKVASGKSTLLSLINALHTDYDGKIFLDGNDIKDYSLKSIHQKISTATQRNHMINDTIYANIVMGDETITDEDINKALEISLPDKTYENREDFLMMQLNENATNISYEMMTGINIARCITHEAELYLFDNVINGYEENIQHKTFENINQYLENKTIIIVADNKQILEQMDKIIIMKDGQVSAIGTHDQLLQKSDYYKQVCHMEGRN